MNSKEEQANRTTAIVAEGGGQRGIYTAGVLDAFLEQKYNPFDLGAGVSAGSMEGVPSLSLRSGFMNYQMMSRYSRVSLILDSPRDQ